MYRQSVHYKQMDLTHILTVLWNHAYAWHWVCIIFLVLCRRLWTVKSLSNNCGVHVVCIPWHLKLQLHVWHLRNLFSDHRSVNVNPWVCLCNFCILVRQNVLANHLMKLHCRDRVLNNQHIFSNMLRWSTVLISKLICCSKK